MSKTIREVQADDIPVLTDIYNHYITDSTATFETEPITEAGMQSRVEAISAHYPYLVAEEEGEVTGYCYAHPWKERAAYRLTLETTVYLSPRHTGKGTGSLLMQRLIDDCRLAGFHVLIACITAENVSSCSFHERLGFRKVSHFVKVGEKFHRLLDVVDYELLLHE